MQKNQTQNEKPETFGVRVSEELLTFCRENTDYISYKGRELFREITAGDILIFRGEFPSNENKNGADINYSIGSLIILHDGRIVVAHKQGLPCIAVLFNVLVRKYPFEPCEAFDEEIHERDEFVADIFRLPAQLIIS